MRNPFPAIIVTALCLVLAGCGASGPAPTPAPSPTSPTGSTTPVVQPISPIALSFITTSSTVATGAVLQFAENSTAQRVTLANQIYETASGLYQLTGGKVPTPATFNGVLAAYNINGLSQYTSYTTALDSLYATYYAKYAAGSIKAQDVLAVINALAQGAEDGASAYATVAAPVAPTTSTGT
jgi:predicted small lipoprotein YifL